MDDLLDRLLKTTKKNYPGASTIAGRDLKNWGQENKHWAQCPNPSRLTTRLFCAQLSTLLIDCLNLSNSQVQFRPNILLAPRDENFENPQFNEREPDYPTHMTIASQTLARRADGLKV